MGDCYYDDDGNVRALSTDAIVRYAKSGASDASGRGGDGDGDGAADMIRPFSFHSTGPPPHADRSPQPKTRATRAGDNHRGRAARHAGSGGGHSEGGGRAGAWDTSVTAASPTGGGGVTHEDVTTVQLMSDVHDVGDELSSPRRGRASRRHPGAHHQPRHAAPTPGAVNTAWGNDAAPQPKRMFSAKSLKRVFSGWNASPRQRASAEPNDGAARTKSKKGGGWKFWKRGK